MATVSSPANPAPATTKVKVELDLADMLSVGQSLRSRARKAADIPEGVRIILARVGDEMVKAAQAEIRRWSAMPVVKP